MAAEVKVPQLGESVVEATVGRWLKGEGDAITAGEPLVELETDKVNMEVPSTSGGTLQQIVKPEGEQVGIGDVLALIDENGAAPVNGGSAQAVPTRQTEATSAPQPSGEEGDGARATPLARRVAAEHGVDLEAVQGTGPSGRVRREDVDSYLRGEAATKPAASQPSPASPPAASRSSAERLPVPLPPSEETQRWEERVPMSRRRRTIAQRLVEAQHTAAMLTTFNEVDMTAIMDLRRRRKDAFKDRYGVNLGFMSFFTRAVVGALKEFPRLNAEVQGDGMIIKHYYDIGIAVGVEEGLVVPVLRDADRMTFAQIEKQIAALAEKARSNALTLSDLQGGTFTISNGGTFGSLLSTPILNAPQVGILGMHKIEERPIALDGQVVIHPMMYLALSYDHRIVDGNEAVRFLVRIKGLLEDPETLLLEG